MADLAFNFSQLDPDVLSEYLRQKKTQALLQPREEIPKQEFVGSTVQKPTFEAPSKAPEMMPDLSPQDTSPKSLTGSLSPEVPDLTPKIPTNYDLDQELMRQREAAQKEPPETPFAVQRAVSQIQNVPRERDYDQDVSKTRKIMAVLGGVGAGVVGGLPGAMSAYRQIRHPDWVREIKDYNRQTAADKLASDIAIREQNAQTGSQKVDVAQEGLDIRKQLLPGQIAKNLANTNLLNKKVENVRTPEQLAELAQNTAKARADEAARVRTRPIYKLAGPNGEKVEAQQDPVTGKWYDSKDVAKGPMLIPQGWTVEGKIANVPNATNAMRTHWQAGMAQLLNEFGGDINKVPADRLDKLDNEIAEAKVTGVRRQTADASTARANAMIDRANIYHTKEAGTDTVPQVIAPVGGGRSVAPIRSAAPQVQVQPPSTPPAASSPAAAPQRTVAAAPQPAQQPRKRTPKQDFDYNVEKLVEQVRRNPGMETTSIPSLYRNAVQNKFMEQTGKPFPVKLTAKEKQIDESARASIASAGAVEKLMNSDKRLWDNIGPIVGWWQKHVTEPTGREWIRGIPDDLQENAQHLLTLLRQTVGAESNVTGNGSQGKYLLQYIGPGSVDVRMDPPLFKGALAGLKDFANTRLEALEETRYHGKYPRADIEPDAQWRPVGHDTVKLSSGKSVWKHLKNMDTGELRLTKPDGSWETEK